MVGLHFWCIHHTVISKNVIWIFMPKGVKFWARIEAEICVWGVRVWNKNGLFDCIPRRAKQFSMITASNTGSSPDNFIKKFSHFITFHRFSKLGFTAEGLPRSSLFTLSSQLQVHSSRKINAPLPSSVFITVTTSKICGRSQTNPDRLEHH